MAHNKNKGYIALATVVILTGILVAITATLSLGMITDLLSYRSVIDSEKIFSSVDSCVEEALLRIRSDASYNGGLILLPTITCQVQQVKLRNRINLTIYNTTGLYIRQVLVILDHTNSGISIVGRREY
ncbi:MAG: hypothetical protein WCO06_03220 [Candidatus Roizmanbacteria bacterium]